MAHQSLLTTQTPSSTDNHDLGGAGGATATAMLFAVDGTIFGPRVWITDTIGGTYTAEVWEANALNADLGTRIAVQNFTPAGSGWQEFEFTSKPAVTAGKVYVIAWWSSAGRYVALGGGLASAIVNGDITGIQDGTDPVGSGTVHNGRFKSNGGPNVYPIETNASGLYFVDVLFDTGDEPVEVTLTPAALTLSAVELTAIPQPVSVVLTPAVLTLAAVAFAAAPQPVAVMLTPAALTLAAVALALTPGPVTVSLTPAVLSLAAVAVLLAGERSTVARPFSGIVSRPDTGVVVRP